MGLVEPRADQGDLGLIEAQRLDLRATVAEQDPVEDGVGAGIGDAEVALVGLAFDQVGLAGFETITSGTPRCRARAQTWVLKRSPIGFTGGESSACQVKYPSRRSRLVAGAQRAAPAARRRDRTE